MTRRVTLYEYLNLSFPENSSCRKSLLYVDDHYNYVMFQSRSHVTPWHGSFCINGVAGCMTLNFDAFAGSSRRPNGQLILRSCTMWENVLGELNGHDYHVRRIRMTPVAKYMFCEQFQAWENTHTWSAVGWTAVENAFHVIDTPYGELAE